MAHNARFNTTRWAMVLACADDDSSAHAQEALASLFQVYWYPLYAYVRRRDTGSGHRSPRPGSRIHSLTLS